MADKDVCGWVLEFLLRQKSIDDHTLISLLSSLPFPSTNMYLNKCILLRCIQYEISNGSVSENILNHLEKIKGEEEEKSKASETMKGAYWRVAVDFTVKLLDNEAEYFSAVKRFWRGRVSKMEEEEEDKDGGLISDELKKWKDEIEDAVWDPSVRQNVRMRSKSINALGSVKLYLAEAWESLGPAFLELVSGMVKGSEGTLREKLGRDFIVTPFPPPKPSQDPIFSKNNGGGGVVLEKSDVALPRRKHVAKKRYRDGTCITDPEPLDESIGGDDLQQAPRATSNDIRSDRTNRTCKRDDDDSMDGSSLPEANDSSSKIHLPKRNLVSPLKKCEQPMKERRKPKRWSSVEEDALREGVEKYGSGNWKVILNEYQDIFVERTEVDLKDKWRNLTK